MVPVGQLHCAAVPEQAVRNRIKDGRMKQIQDVTMSLLVTRKHTRGDGCIEQRHDVLKEHLVAVQVETAFVG